MTEHTFDVVGITYRVTPATLRDMEKLAPLEAELRRQRDNEHDENAIQVFIVEKPWRGFHIGYLRREVCAALAPKIDAEEITISAAMVSDFDTSNATASVNLTIKHREKRRG